MSGWIEKQRSILDFALSSLLRRKGKNIGLLLTFVLLVFVLGSALFFNQAMKKVASLILKDAPEMVVQRVLQGRYDPIPLSYMDKIKEIGGVSFVGARLWGYIYDSNIGANFTLMVPRKSPPPREKIVLGNGISRKRMVYRGEFMAFRLAAGNIRTFTVQEVIPPESELISADLVLLSEIDFRDIFGLSAQLATDLVVRASNQKDLPIIARQISDMLPDTRSIPQNEIARTYDSVFDWQGGIMVVLLAMALLALIILSWEKASGMSAEEKREIGILKALGWETGEVIALKSYEGLVISFFSFTIGLLLAYGHVFLLSAFLFSPALKGWSVLYPAFRLPPFLDLYPIAGLFFLTIIPYTISTVVPSWRAAIVDPDSVMRS